MSNIQPTPTSALLSDVFAVELVSSIECALWISEFGDQDIGGDCITPADQHQRNVQLCDTTTPDLRV
ncbi:MAG: hypothetical protein AAF434_05760 [Pseudomonadota bacterium]